jgi:hypothetical protein
LRAKAADTAVCFARSDYFEIEGEGMSDPAAARGELIRYLENALAIADEIEDGKTGYLIERALDEARSRQFAPMRGLQG